MDTSVRRLLTFECEGDTLHATLDDAAGTSGLLVVSGGNEIRIGAHRGMARLAGDIAAAGYPVFRFDRRGVGDSEGTNAGFGGSGPDITSAIAAFRAHCPALTRIVAFGNCDAASALMLHSQHDVAHAVIANPWVIESEAGLPPPAAVKAHYLRRLRDPKALLGLVTGTVDFKKLARGIASVSKPASASPLATMIAEGMTSFSGSITILLAERDGTACAFAAEWAKPVFEKARNRNDVAVVTLDSASHSFAGDADYSALKFAILDALGQ